MWFVLQTHPQREPQALFHVKRQGFTTFNPSYIRKVKHARTVKEVRRPMFPGYLFVAFDPSEDQWLCLKSTYGVASIVGTPAGPTPVPAYIMAELAVRADSTGTVDLGHGYKPGDRVTVPSLWDAEAIIGARTDKERVEVLLSILGRQAPVMLRPEDVRAA